MVVDATDGYEDVIMNRREFFTAGIKTVSKKAVQIADDHVSQRARHWIRPPYALDELDFLLACTRCDVCVESCPHDVIFKLSTRLGAQVAGTPALDLLNNACHLHLAGHRICKTLISYKISLLSFLNKKLLSLYVINNSLSILYHIICYS